MCGVLRFKSCLDGGVDLGLLSVLFVLLLLLRLSLFIALGVDRDAEELIKEEDQHGHEHHKEEPVRRADIIQRLADAPEDKRVVALAVDQRRDLVGGQVLIGRKLVGHLGNRSVIAPSLVAIEAFFISDFIDDSMGDEDVLAVGVLFNKGDDVAHLILGIIIKTGRSAENQIAVLKVAALVAVGGAAFHGVGLDGLDRHAENIRDAVCL